MKPEATGVFANGDAQGVGGSVSEEELSEGEELRRAANAYASTSNVAPKQQPEVWPCALGSPRGTA